MSPYVCYFTIYFFYMRLSIRNRKFKTYFLILINWQIILIYPADSKQDIYVYAYVMLRIYTQ